jgi:hypothetical protein
MQPKMQGRHVRAYLHEGIETLCQQRARSEERSGVQALALQQQLDETLHLPPASGQGGSHNLPAEDILVDFPPERADGCNRIGEELRATVHTISD